MAGGSNPKPQFSSGIREFWIRHRSLFWTLHSIWALAAGIAVIVIAQDRYKFVPWALLFLGLTWGSTLYFNRSFRRTDASRKRKEAMRTPGLGKEITSYLTRAMYQQTLFFLLPFYWYSTVVKSLNVVFLILIAGLALFSCVELVFDRWLRTRPVFGLVFFATVTFAVINLLLPLLLPIDPAVATPLAAIGAVGSAIPLTARGSLGTAGQKIRFWLACVLFVGVGIGLPRLVPPVPLKLQRAIFTSNIDRHTLVPADTLTSGVGSNELGGTLFVLIEVFAPSIVPTPVILEWSRNGQAFRTSREVEITAHDLGFRVWDGFRPESGRIAPGRYVLVLRTGQGRVFGHAGIEIGGDDDVRGR